LRWLSETILPKLVKEPEENSEPDEDEASDEAILHEANSNTSVLPYAPPRQKAMLLCSLPAQFRHLKWWLTMCFADH
jgi:hypothetical protein